MIRLVCESEQFDRWLTAEVERSIDQFAYRYSLSILPDSPISIAMGDYCTIFSDETMLVSGYVNRVNARIDEKSFKIAIEGRSSTGDLVDCSAVHKTGSWTNRNGNQIASDLCSPFDISVTGEASEPFPYFALEPGESVHSALDRLCKVRGLLPVTRANGAVQLLDIGEEPTEDLDLSRCISRSVSYDDSDRYSVYLMRATGTAKAEITDDGITRYRPLVVISDAPAGTAQAKKRAQWEANVRAGRSERARYVLLGEHTQEPGTVFGVWDNILGIDEALVLLRSVIRTSNEEAVTEFEMCRPQAYSTLEYPKKTLTGRTKRGKQITHKTRRGT